MENLGYLDFVFLSIIFIIGIRGAFVGFAKELFGILGVIVGVFFASRFADDAGKYFKERIYNFDSQTLDTFIGFIIVLVSVWVVALILGVIFKRVMDILLPKYVNVILGGVFGALKSYFMLAIILYFALNVDFMKNTKAHIFQNSVIYSSMDSIASKVISSKLISHSPKNIKEVQEELHHIQESTMQEVKSGLQNGTKTLQDGAKEMLESGKTLLGQKSLENQEQDLKEE